MGSADFVVRTTFWVGRAEFPWLDLKGVSRDGSLASDSLLLLPHRT